MEMLVFLMEQVYSPSSSWTTPDSVMEPLVSRAMRGSDSRGGLSSPSLRGVIVIVRHIRTPERKPGRYKHSGHVDGR